MGFSTCFMRSPTYWRPASCQRMLTEDFIRTVTQHSFGCCIAETSCWEVAEASTGLVKVLKELIVCDRVRSAVDCMHDGGESFASDIPAPECCLVQE